MQNLFEEIKVLAHQLTKQAHHSFNQYRLYPFRKTIQGNLLYYNYIKNNFCRVPISVGTFLNYTGNGFLLQGQSWISAFSISIPFYKENAS